MQPKFDQNHKKYEILTVLPGYEGMVKKPSNVTVPLRLRKLTLKKAHLPIKSGHAAQFHAHLFKVIQESVRSVHPAAATMCQNVVVTRKKIDYFPFEL
jgi:hypothetical protein